MAKSLDQLQKELGVASEKARKAYDILNGTGGRGGLERDYNLAVKNKNKEAIAKLEPLYNKAVEDYKTAQEAKNAANLELTRAKKEAETSKITAAKSKVAQSVYSKAIEELAQAEGKFAGYKGQEGYIAAYQKAQQAFDDAQKAGVAVTALPAPKVAIPVITQGATGGTGGTGTVPEKPLNEIITFLSDPANSSILAKAQIDLKKNFPSVYKGSTDGKWSLDFQKALGTVAGNRAMLPNAALKGTDLLSFITAPTADIGLGGGAASTGKTGIGAPGTTGLYSTVYSATDAESEINKVFQDRLKRNATPEEIASFTKALTAAQAKNPTMVQYTANGTRTTTGLDPVQFIISAIDKNKTLKSEADTILNEAPDLVKRLSDKKIYDKLIAAAGNDLTKILEAKQTTAYGRGLAEYEAIINDKILETGASNTPEEVSALAKSLYDKGITANSYTGSSQIDSALKFGANKEGKYTTGTAGTTASDLQKTAVANGLDLNNDFGDKLSGWISAINQGEKVDNIKQQIRDIAALGQPDSVKKMIANGIDLATIYSPYKKTMAATLEIQDPNSISLNDPVLRSAITPQGEMNLYDYQKALRKDNRWQYTQQANQEVASATQQVLKDFGFMG